MANLETANFISTKEQEDTRSHRGRALVAGAAIFSTLAGVGFINAGGANADRCFIVGGATDGSGIAAENAYRATGQLASCNEGVERVEYPANFWPSGGPIKNKDELPPAAADLTNRLNNTPDWQHKRVLGFSEGAMVAGRSSTQTGANNVTFELSGGPEGRTGMFNSALYNAIPLVKPIAEGIIGVDSSTQLRERPGIEIQRKYSKGDMFANAQPQGLDPFALISGADMMARMGSHSIETQHNPVIANFEDGDGIQNVVFDDGSPFTRVGNQDPAVMAPNPGPEVPPLFPGMQPVPFGAPAPNLPPPPPAPSMDQVLWDINANIHNGIVAFNTQFGLPLPPPLPPRPLV